MIEACALKNLGAFNSQNCANLLWGLAKLQYQPTKLLGPICEKMAQPQFLQQMKPVEVSDAAFALALLGKAAQ